MREGPALCVLCPAGTGREPLSASLACGVCRDRVDACLTDIAARYGRLSATPEGRGLDGGRQAPGFESRLPGSAHVWALRDRRSIPGRGRDGVFAPPAVLEFYVRVVAGQRNLWDMPTAAHGIEGFGSSPEQVNALAGLLRRHLDFVCTQAYVVDFAEDVRRCADQLRAATGDPNPKPVGHCTAMLPRPEGDPRRDMVRCDRALFSPRDGGTLIRCRACAAEYDGTDLIRLAIEARARKDAPA